MKVRELRAMLEGFDDRMEVFVFDGSGIIFGRLVPARKAEISELADLCVGGGFERAVEDEPAAATGVVIT